MRSIVMMPPFRILRNTSRANLFSQLNGNISNFIGNSELVPDDGTLLSEISCGNIFGEDSCTFGLDGRGGRMSSFGMGNVLLASISDDTGISIECKYEDYMIKNYLLYFDHIHIARTVKDLSFGIRDPNLSYLQKRGNLTLFDVELDEEQPVWVNLFVMHDAVFENEFENEIRVIGQRGQNFFHPSNEVKLSRSFVVEICGMLPTPSESSSYEDIIHFKRMYRSELSQLWLAIDAIYENFCACCSDPSYKKNSLIEEVKNALEAIENASRKERLPVR